jgi:hypothetical protein
MIAMLIEKPYRNHLNILRLAGADFLIEELARAINRRATAQMPRIIMIPRVRGSENLDPSRVNSSPQGELKAMEWRLDHFC